MNKPKVFVPFKRSPHSAVIQLEEKADVVFHQSYPPDYSKILAEVIGASVLCVYPKVSVGKKLMDAAGPQLKGIVTVSSGTDHIDMVEAKRRGIQIGCARGVNIDAVADLAVMLALAAARRAYEARLLMNENRYDTLYGKDMVGSIVGVVGLGGIGLNIVRRLSSFRVSQFLYSGRKEKIEAVEFKANFVTFDFLIRESDFVFISCALTDDTREIFDAGVFSKMKNSAVLVNVARGEIIKQPDLVDALKNGGIFAAGLDVFTPEPLPQGHELLNLPNCVLTPHLGFATENVRTDTLDVTVQNILNVLEDKEVLIAPL